MRNLLLLVLALNLGACSTIQFSQTDTYSPVVTNENWHHGGIFGLVEFSNPENLDHACDGKELKTFTVEKSFLQGFVGGITYSLYSPWNAAFSCN